MIVSKFSIPELTTLPPPKINLSKAPLLNIPRYKTSWSNEGILNYELLVSSKLQGLREMWLNPQSPSSMSILLKLTNETLLYCTKATNVTHELSGTSVPRKRRLPKEVIRAKKHLSHAHRRLFTHMRSFPDTPCDDLRTSFCKAKRLYRCTVRKIKNERASARDHKLHEILNNNPSSTFKYLKSLQKPQSRQIDHLCVGDLVYRDEDVADGFFLSMSSIKTCNVAELEKDSNISHHFENHDLILKLVENKQTIPSLDIKTSNNLLLRLKKSVLDINSITSLHYLYAGNEGKEHFKCLLNGIIANVNLGKLSELNLVLGLILYKGHRKDKFQFK